MDLKTAVIVILLIKPRPPLAVFWSRFTMVQFASHWREFFDLTLLKCSKRSVSVSELTEVN